MKIATHTNNNQSVRVGENNYSGGSSSAGSSSGDVTATANTFKKSIKNTQHNNNNSVRFATSKKVRHCSIETEADETEITRTIISSSNNIDVAAKKKKNHSVIMSLPPLVKSSVRIYAYSHLHSAENTTNGSVVAKKTDTKGPVMMSLDACVQHRSFNDLMKGILEHQRLLLCIRSGWIPTSISFLQEDKRANLCGLLSLSCFFSKKADLIDDIYYDADNKNNENDPKKTNRIDCEATYRALHAKFFASGRRLRAEVLLERDTPTISTESFDLYIFLRDLLMDLGITSNLRYFSRETSQRSLFAQS